LLTLGSVYLKDDFDDSSVRTAVGKIPSVAAEVAKIDSAAVECPLYTVSAYKSSAIDAQRTLVSSLSAQVIGLSLRLCMKWLKSKPNELKNFTDIEFGVRFLTTNLGCKEAAYVYSNS
jgi:hypothetical protein